MQNRRRKPLDLPVTGFLAGFLVPLIIFMAVWFFRENRISFDDYIISLSRLNALVKLGSLCVFANLLVFMGFIRMNYDRAARGVLGATIIYAVAILITKAF
jgi:hypothetical protein